MLTYTTLMFLQEKKKKSKMLNIFQGLQLSLSSYELIFHSLCTGRVFIFFSSFAIHILQQVLIQSKNRIRNVS